MQHKYSNHLYRMLCQYADSDRQDNWLSATVLHKSGSSYRKPGAMMFITPLGKTMGLVSGGCLEADIRREAARVRDFKQATYKVYDTSEEGNIAYELGLGCNGRVGTLIQELGPRHQHIMLELKDRLERGDPCGLMHCFESENAADLNQLALIDEAGVPVASTDEQLPWPSAHLAENEKHKLLHEQNFSFSANLHRAPPSVWVFGGGIDAKPLVQMLGVLGWRVVLLDHRTAYARAAEFPDAERIIRDKPNDFSGRISADAAVLMTHNLELDAAWLGKIKSSDGIGYIGLLGPVSRKLEVFELAGIEPSHSFAQRVYGPMGLSIGGELPESIALSILAQCHSILSV